MNEFDIKAAGWDENPMHWERSVAISEHIRKIIPLTREMTALEFGAGTGITSFLLKDYLKEITLMDNSTEMLKVIDNKIKVSGAENLKSIYYDLEQNDLENVTFDLIFNQMVLHHISDIGNILNKFYKLLNPGGFLAIADLYPEDGLFHGNEFTGHKGFDPFELSKLLLKAGFTGVSHQKCYVLEKKISDVETRHYDIFLLKAKRCDIG